MINTTNLLDNVIINSSATWSIVAEKVKQVDILEHEGIYSVIVVFRAGGDGPDGSSISTDFEQCETLEEAEMKRAEILLQLEKINGHI